MRILIASEVAPGNVNGVTTVLGQVVRRCAARGVPVALAAPRGCRPVPPPIAAAATPVRLWPSVPMPGYPEIRTALATRNRIRWLLDEVRPTVVHLLDPVVFGAAVGHCAAEAGIPVVASFHTHLPAYATHYGLGFATGLAWKLCRCAYRPATLTLVPTRAVGDELTRHGIGPVVVWPRGVDADRFHPRHRCATLRDRLLDGRQHLVLYVGRLAQEKNLPVLLEALAPCPEIRLVLVGDGPLAPELQARYGPVGVHFTGSLRGDDLACHYASADLFAFTSETETYGQVLVEALASGLPVVAVETPVTREVLGGSAPAGLLTVGDPSTFRRVVRRLLADPARRASLAEEGRAFAVRRSWPEALNRLTGWYADVQRDGHRP